MGTVGIWPCPTCGKHIEPVFTYDECREGHQVTVAIEGWRWCVNCKKMVEVAVPTGRGIPCCVKDCSEPPIGMCEFGAVCMGHSYTLHPRTIQDTCPKCGTDLRVYGLDGTLPCTVAQAIDCRCGWHQTAAYAMPD